VKNFFISLLIICTAGTALSKVGVQNRWIQTVAVNSERVKIEVCTTYECEVIGRPQGYTAYEIDSIQVLNSSKLKSMHVKKWTYGIGMAVVGSYLYRIGRIVMSVGFSVLTFPKIKTYDELIKARESFESLPNVLSQDSYELGPEQFLILIEGLKLAVQGYDHCLEHLSQVDSSHRPDLCRDANIVVTPDQFIQQN